MKTLLNNYLQSLKLKAYSPNTIKRYEGLMNIFVKKAHITAPEQITQAKIEAFQKDLSDKNLKNSTQFLYLMAIKSFLTFLKRNSYQVLDPSLIELPKISKNEINLIKPEQLSAFLGAIQEEWLSVSVNVLLSTGLRVSELCKLDRDDLGEEISVKGKGGKIRLVFLSTDCRDKVKSYLSGRADVCQALIVDNLGNRISPRTLQRYMQNYGKKLGFKIWPHALRHYFACNLLKNGADIMSVKDLLGHSSIVTTQLYLHSTNNRLKEIHNKYATL